MTDAIRVMIEQGKRKAVAAAFDWPGWDRAGASEADWGRLTTPAEQPQAAVSGHPPAGGEIRRPGAAGPSRVS